MINSPFLYLFTLALIVTVIYLLESKSKWKFFKYVPAVVLIYAFSMMAASFGVFEYTSEVTQIYKKTKTNILPTMLF
jgi:uncharacterized membrane protein